MADRATPEYGEAPAGYRLPSGTAPGRIRLQVSDLTRSLGYYRDVLGFEVVEQEGSGARLAASGAEQHLLELHELKGARPVPRRGRLGLFHYAILLPDRASLGRFARHIGSLGIPAGSSDHGVSEAIYLQDPDGLGIEVYADRPRATWRHRERELTMVTEPLDTGALLRAAGDAPWSGMPAATAIGHVHLHVGDLAAAQAFYHGALGLDRIVWSYPGALFLSAGGYHHHLGLNTWAAHAAPAGDEDARLIEWELVLPHPDDVDAALDSMRSAGYTVAPADDDNGGVVRDPWGTALRVRTATQ